MLRKKKKTPEKNIDDKMGVWFWALGVGCDAGRKKRQKKAKKSASIPFGADARHVMAKPFLSGRRHMFGKKRRKNRKRDIRNGGGNVFTKKRGQTRNKNQKVQKKSNKMLISTLSQPLF